MKMVDMKMSNKSSKPTLCCDDETKPEYPWGLRINLDNEGLEKIGMEEMPDVGTEMPMQIVAKVVEVSVNSREEGEDMKRLELQITSMAVGSDKKASDTLYGEK